MADFKPHGGGTKRFGGAGGKASFGDRGGKPAFHKKSWGNDSRSGERTTTMHKANCSSCGNECEVPFRPVNGKPVFCRNCFVKTGDTASAGRAGDRFQKRDFNARPQTQSFATRSEMPRNSDAVLKSLEMVNSKLDRLITAIEVLSGSKPVVVHEGLKDAVATAVKKAPAKKSTKK